jgi:hypothetical protein
MRLADVLVWVQASTMLALGLLLIRTGVWRLGVAQLLLFGVTALVYL